MEGQTPIQILDSDESEVIRKQYINTFVNTESVYYRERILAIRQYEDGLCYTGYLWDCLGDTSPISFEEASSVLRTKGGLALIMWDLNTSKYIRIKDYWKFPKSSVLMVPLQEFWDHQDLLPEDIYIFDRTFSWSIVLTHEYSDDNSRWCLSARPRGLA